jgi:hypothetical protein
VYLPDTVAELQRHGLSPATLARDICTGCDMAYLALLCCAAPASSIPSALRSVCSASPSRS